MMAARIHHDTYRATTLADARAAAIQAIDEMHEARFEMVRLEAHREGAGYAIDVTYRRDEQ